MSEIEMVNVLVFLSSIAPLDQWYAVPNHYHCNPELFHVNNLWKTADKKLSRIFVVGAKLAVQSQQRRTMV